MRIRHECSATFDFFLTDEQRARVESALQHDEVENIRWVPYPMKQKGFEMATVVVAFRPCLNELATAEALAFVRNKFQCLDDSLERLAAV